MINKMNLVSTKSSVLKSGLLKFADIAKISPKWFTASDVGLSGASMATFVQCGVIKIHGIDKYWCMVNETTMKESQRYTYSLASTRKEILEAYDYLLETERKKILSEIAFHEEALKKLQVKLVKWEVNNMIS